MKLCRKQEKLKEKKGRADYIFYKENIQRTYLLKKTNKKVPSLIVVIKLLKSLDKITNCVFSDQFDVGT